MRIRGIIAVLLLHAAAAQAPGQVPGDEAARPDPQQVYRQSGGSLLQASLAGQAVRPDLSGVSFFAVKPPEPRIIRKHDLVTIIVRQESEFKSEGATDTSKEASLEAAIEEWIRFNDWNLEGGGLSAVPPKIELSGKRDFKGESTVDRSDSLILRIQAEVIDVKPNDTLVLQARSHIQTDEEEQFVVLSGVCRSEDVSLDNTVLSTQLHDLSITKEHKGAVRDATKRGWVPKLLDVVNPF